MSYHFFIISQAGILQWKTLYMRWFSTCKATAFFQVFFVLPFFCLFQIHDLHPFSSLCPLVIKRMGLSVVSDVHQMQCRSCRQQRFTAAGGKQRNWGHTWCLSLNLCVLALYIISLIQLMEIFFHQIIFIAIITIVWHCVFHTELP